MLAVNSPVRLVAQDSVLHHNGTSVGSVGATVSIAVASKVVLSAEISAFGVFGGP